MTNSFSDKRDGGHNTLTIPPLAPLNRNPCKGKRGSNQSWTKQKRARSDDSMDEEPLPKRRYVLLLFLHTLGSDLTFSLEENSGHCEKGDQDDAEV